MVQESVASNNFPPKGETFTLSPTATTLSSPLVRRRWDENGLYSAESKLL